jgi:fibro-slime domain-containing protein
MRAIKWTVLGSLTLAVPAAMGSPACGGKGTVVYQHGVPSGMGQAGAGDDDDDASGTGAAPAATGGRGHVVGTGGSAAEGAAAGTAGAEEKVVAFCGDGIMNRAEEQCDDGANVSGDGCTETCLLEAGWVCPTPGQPCQYTVFCGDGKIGVGETCDDGNLAAGDGCSATCQLEAGYACPVPKAACRPICGDGVVLGREECDDGVDPTTQAPVGQDGCNETCHLEAGWVCLPGEACRPTVCGDYYPEGSEQCDDGNLLPYDGCSKACTLEPKCGTDQSPVGACSSSCGDGIMLASDAETCDDGNQVPGDGCSDTCTKEEGYECAALTDEPPEKIELPIVYRDFKAGWEPMAPVGPGPGGDDDDDDDTTADTPTAIAGGHPDFERPFGVLVDEGLQAGIVQPALGLDRKPIYAGTADVPIPGTTGPDAFNQWYRDVPDVNKRIDATITLARQTDGSYSMNSATDDPWRGLGGFFPLDGLDETQTWGAEGQNHTYLFTSELRYWFEYKGGEELLFSGDDDVFVFINGTLALDLGGVHRAAYGRIQLDTAGGVASCTVAGAGGGVRPGGGGGATTCTPVALTTPFGLELGKIYEVVLFQAERHTTESNYWLTLTNFLASTTTCDPVCGDGIQTPDEACDLGKDKNTGEHGGCNSDCTLAPYCGDAHIDTDFGEQCDDGVNTSLYGGCAPGCVLGPSCGDGQLQTPWEQCDLGKDKNTGEYGGCNADCTIAPYCGDNHIDEPREKCDDGKANGTTNCREDCTLKIVI